MTRQAGVGRKPSKPFSPEVRERAVRLVQEQQGAHMLPSMTDGAHCYQNAVAERVWKSSARGFPRAWQHHFVLTVSR
jgi:transposase-like protein